LLLPLLWVGVSCRVHPAGGERAPAGVPHEYVEVHMGTRVHIALHASSRAVADRAARAAYDRVAGLEDIFSDYRPQSELNRIGSSAGTWVPASHEMLRVMGLALHVAEATDGAFDPTIRPLVALWREARDTGVPPSAARMDSARALVGWRGVKVDTARGAIMLARTGMQLDMGGIAKGFILDEAMRVLREHGVNSALIEAGGDIVAGAAPPGRSGWTVQVPGAGPSFASRAAVLANEAIATSGSAAQFVEAGGVRHSHVMDPRSGLGVPHALTAHVIHPDAAAADALATALSVMGPAGVDVVRQRFPRAEVALTGSQ